MTLTSLKDLEGWTVVPDSLVEEVGPITALVFGMVWRYCHLRDRVCRASLETLSLRLGLSRMTLIRHLKLLVQLGYLEDLTPHRRYKPHAYADTGKLSRLKHHRQAQQLARAEVVLEPTDLPSPPPNQQSCIPLPGGAICNQQSAINNPQSPTRCLNLVLNAPDESSQTGIPNLDTSSSNLDTSSTNLVPVGVQICDLKKSNIRSQEEDRQKKEALALKFWASIVRQLAHDLSLPNMNRLIYPARPQVYDQDVLWVLVADEEARAWLQSRLQTTVDRQLQDFTINPQARVEFIAHHLPPGPALPSELAPPLPP